MIGDDIQLYNGLSLYCIVTVTSEDHAFWYAENFSDGTFWRIPKASIQYDGHTAFSTSYKRVSK